MTRPTKPTSRALRTDAIRVAVTTQLLMILYFIVTNHVPLHPWNDLVGAGSQLASTAMGVIPFAVFAVAFRSRRLARFPPPSARWARWVSGGTMVIGAVWAWVWLALQIRQWWVPYVLGPTPLHRDFAWFAQGGYTDTLTLLPAVAGRPVPDVQHLVLQCLSLAVAVTMTAATLREVRFRATP